MDDKKPPFLEEEGLEEEAGDLLELEGGEGLAESAEGAEEMLGEEGGEMEFTSPSEALAAALEEHGPDAGALMDWFGQYGYELVETGGGMEEGAPPEFDLIAMRNKAAAGAFPGEMA